MPFILILQFVPTCNSLISSSEETPDITAATGDTKVTSPTSIDDLPVDCMLAIFSKFTARQKIQIERGTYQLIQLIIPFLMFYYLI